MRRTVALIALFIAVTGIQTAKAQTSNPADPASDKTAAGEHLFKQYCSACHSQVQDQKIVGPSLYHELKGPTPKKTPAEVRTILANGKGVMPSFKAQLAPADVEELIAYLRAH